MLRLLPALLRQPQQGHGVDSAPQLLIQPVAVAEEDLALLSVCVCLALCTGPPRVLVYKTAGRNLILCQHYSCHDELKGRNPKNGCLFALAAPGAGVTSERNPLRPTGSTLLTLHLSPAVRPPAGHPTFPVGPSRFPGPNPSMRALMIRSNQYTLSRAI